MIPKPKHLGPEYGEQFQDPGVAAAYRYRPPYPEETFAILTGLITATPRRVLDVGCGTGYLARPLAPQVAAVDAVDISAAMIAQGRRLPGGDAPNLRWLLGTVETAPLTPPYALITAGESLHWLPWETALPRFYDLLAPGGYLAIVSKRFSAPPWQEELNVLTARYSTNREYAAYDLVAELTKRGLFEKVREQETTPVTYRQSVADYVASFHSSNGFSRDRMGPDKAAAFDTAVARLVSRHHSQPTFDIQVSGHLVWGRPEKE